MTTREANRMTCMIIHADPEKEPSMYDLLRVKWVSLEEYANQFDNRLIEGELGRFDGMVIIE
jgi:hypothetical protein